MTESTEKNLKEPIPTLEQKELISKTTILIVELVDFYNNRKGEDILRKTNQLMEKIDDLVIKELFKNLGKTLDTCNKGGDESALRKAVNSSRIEVKKE